MPARSSSTWSTPISPVMPWYDGADEAEATRQLVVGGAADDTVGMRVCGTASADAPTVTTASQPSRRLTAITHWA